MIKYYSLDIETHDPHLTDKGVSWVYGNGEILCTAVYDAQKKEKWACKKWNKKVVAILEDPDAVIIGAKIDYDIGWLLHETGATLRATCIDIFFAEALINEYGRKDLDILGKKYLKQGKQKSELESWCADNGLKGDFRKHLKQAMQEGQWEAIKEYVLSDAELPYLIYQKQKVILEKEELTLPFMVDCALIPIVLKMKIKGIRLDLQKRKKNYKLLHDKFTSLRSEFTKRYGEVNFNSPKQLATFFDSQGAGYNIKFTLKGRHGVKYEQSDRFITDDLRQAFDEVARTVQGFKFKKKKLLCAIEKQYADRVKYLLTKAGFMFTANPILDKNALASMVEYCPVVDSILKIKKIDSILEKFLGEDFDRFIVDGRIHADFNISKTDEYGTVSGRFSMSNPNLQQVPSKGESDDILLAEICRELFIPEAGHWLLKIDYSQIEYRLLVHYAVGRGAEEARKMFRDNPMTDYHKFVMDLTGLERKPAKNCNFGIMYGMGLFGMMEAFGWSKEHCEDILDKYHSALPYVGSTMKLVRKVAEERGYITTIGKRRARCLVKEASYAFLNRLNQGSAADIMKTAMIEADKQGVFDILIPHITVHDELVCSVPKTKEGIEAVTKLRKIMESVIPLKVPLIAEPELGTDWFNVSTAYYRELKSGELELVHAEFGYALKEDKRNIVTSKGEHLIVSDADVIIHSMDNKVAVVKSNFFNVTFKEVV